MMRATLVFLLPIIGYSVAFSICSTADVDDSTSSTPHDSPIRQLSQPFWTTGAAIWGCYSPPMTEHAVINSTVINFVNRPFCFEALWAVFEADEFKHNSITIKMNKTQSNQLVTLYDGRDLKEGAQVAQLQLVASEPFRIQFDLKPAFTLFMTYAYEGTCLVRPNLMEGIASSYKYTFANNCICK